MGCREIDVLRSKTCCGRGGDGDTDEASFVVHSTRRVNNVFQRVNTARRVCQQRVRTWLLVRLSYPRGLYLVAGRRRAWLTWVGVDNRSKHSVYEETNRWIPKTWGSVALI